MRHGVWFFLFFSLLLASVWALEQQPEKCIFFRVFWENGDYHIDNLRVVMDFPLKIDPAGAYLAKMVDAKGNVLYQHKTKKFNMALEPSTEPSLGETMQDQNLEIDFDQIAGTMKGQMFFLLPFVQAAKSLSFEHGTNVLAKADLSGLCKPNGKCEAPENFLSCPEDCPLEKKDQYCYAYIDGVCDPDCVKGLDPDCDGDGSGTSVHPKSLSLEEIYSIVVVVAVFVLIAAYNVLKRKKKRKAGR